VTNAASWSERPDKENMDTDPKLLEILVCPQTKTTLHYDRDKQELVSRAAGLAYPIRGGVPVMLTGEARQLSDEERDALRR
jgi:uncharacterized protein YbaR (Trm112 family)